MRMKPVFIREDKRDYLQKMGAFAFVTAVSVAVWQIMKVRGSEIFVAACAIAFLYCLYGYFFPTKLLRLDSKGAKLLASNILIPWNYIYEVNVQPFIDGEHENPKKRYVVCRGYSPRAESIVEWWRLPVGARRADKVAAQVWRMKELYSGKVGQK